MYFDADLCDWNDGKGPALTVLTPTYFVGGDGSEYDGDGVMTVPLQAVLEDYLLNFKKEDGGEGVPAFCKWLRDYADRLEAANTTDEPRPGVGSI
jgi:hypothetical protein